MLIRVNGIRLILDLWIIFGMYYYYHVRKGRHPVVETATNRTKIMKLLIMELSILLRFYDELGDAKL